MITGGGAVELLSRLLQFRDINNPPFFASQRALREIFTLAPFLGRGDSGAARPLVMPEGRQTAIYSTRSEVNPRRDLTSFPLCAYPGF